MSKQDILKLLRECIDNTVLGCSKIKVPIIEKHCNIIYETLARQQEINENLLCITQHVLFDGDYLEWRYLLNLLYIMSEIGRILSSSDNEMLSIKEIRELRSLINFICQLGIYSNLSQEMPFHIKPMTIREDCNIYWRLNMLKCTLIALCEFLDVPGLKGLIILEALRPMLIGLYYIIYYPLRKNSEMFDEVKDHKLKAKALLQKLRATVNPILLIKETMAMQHKEVPNWFKMAISRNLTDTLTGPMGVHNVAAAMLTKVQNDKSLSWATFDVIFRLVYSCKNRPDFERNLCQQLVDLIDETTENSLIFENLFVVCAKEFYKREADDGRNISKSLFFKKLTDILFPFILEDYQLKEGDCTEQIMKVTRLLHALFVENTVGLPNLPVELLTVPLKVIFKIHNIALNNFKTTSKETEDILLKYLNASVENDIAFFDSFVFGIHENCEIKPLKKNVEWQVNQQKILVKKTEQGLTTSVFTNCEMIEKLLDGNQKLQMRFFKYLLQCLVHREKYFKETIDLHSNVEPDVLSDYIERSITVFRMLAHFAEDKKIQKELINSPAQIIQFIRDVLEQTITAGLHRIEKEENEEFRTLFTTIMILKALVENRTKTNFQQFNALLHPLNTIKAESTNKEIVDLIDNITRKIISKTEGKVETERPKTEFDKIIEDICDPLLPVRGHGLIALRKFVQDNPTLAAEKRQYILTIFQQNLKSDDSFIFLSAIEGLAVMANAFPSVVLASLCEEYTGCGKTNEFNNEVRVKLGEVLGRVIKKMSQRKVKENSSIILNAVFIGVKDEDHFIRASSLSNIAEMCGKLPTVNCLQEILSCVQAVIDTDKAYEPRRAAVCVLRMLFKGLNEKVLLALKDDLFPLYKLLRQLYRDDSDDVMRLQAQVALEELNVCIREHLQTIQRFLTEKERENIAAIVSEQ